MTASPNDPIRELKAVLAEHLPWHGARISFLAQFLLALLKVRSVSLAELATGFAGPAKVDSHYKRLQRFFRSFEIGCDGLARLLVRIGPVGDGPWRPALDRTNWQFGKTDITTSCSASPCRCSGRAGQGGQLRHRRARRPDGALPRRLRRSQDRGAPPPASSSARRGSAGSNNRASRSTSGSSATPSSPTAGTG